MQSDGVEVAGVPIGTTAFVHAVVSARVVSYEAVHERVRLLQCMCAECICDPACELGGAHGVSGACVWTCDCAAGTTDRVNRQAPLEAHDEQVRRTLSALLQRPWDTD